MADLCAHSFRGKAALMASDPQERLYRRVQHLPFAIASTRRKLARLEEEALQLGLKDLVDRKPS